AYAQPRGPTRSAYVRVRAYVSRGPGSGLACGGPENRGNCCTKRFPDNVVAPATRLRDQPFWPRRTRDPRRTAASRDMAVPVFSTQLLRATSVRRMRAMTDLVRLSVLVRPFRTDVAGSSRAYHGHNCPLRCENTAYVQHDGSAIHPDRECDRGTG